MKYVPQYYISYFYFLQELKNKFDVLQGEHKLLQKQVKDKAQKVVSLENELNRIADNHRTW